MCTTCFVVDKAYRSSFSRFMALSVIIKSCLPSIGFKLTFLKKEWFCSRLKLRYTLPKEVYPLKVSLCDDKLEFLITNKLFNFTLTKANFTWQFYSYNCH